ncbi:EamA family transporter [Rhodobacterales bacterium 52_120_T64]|nr:EamA family transporter [Rhodobacterales bacterium 52_120_T64]
MNDRQNNLKGAFYMMASMAGFVLNDTMVKLASDELDLFQAVFIRGAIATFLLGLLAWNKGALSFRPSRRDIKIIGWRTVAEVGATFCFLTALFNMPLANATAILQSLPLAVTLAASLFLGHKVGWRRYLAITLGFVGVLIIVRPGTGGFNAYSLWALASVAFITLRDLLSHKLAPSTPSIFVALITSGAVMIFAGVFATTQEWRTISLETFALLGAAAVFILVGYVSAITAMRHGDISFVSPFRYSILIWALVLGILIFKEIPDVWTIAGSAIVVGMGIFTFYRERVSTR